MNHLAEVAELVARATRANDPEVIIAAVLHDTVEDTETSIEELKALFGERVAGLVAEVTDDKSLPKQTRKDLQVAHAAHASRGAQIIKLADKQVEADRVTASVKGAASEVGFEVFFLKDAARTPALVRVPLALGTFSMELVR